MVASLIPLNYALDDETHNATLDIERTIDIQEEASSYFKLDYMTSVAYTPRGYMVASLIPLNYAQATGWLAFIDTESEYISHFVALEECFSPKHVVSTSDGTRLVVACEGLADDGIADPQGSITVMDTSSDDISEWRLFSVGFTEFDDCDDDSCSKHLPSGIYQPQPESAFSVNAEPEYIALDDTGHYAYISLQENNAVAILDLQRLEMQNVFSFGAHDFGFSGLDPSDRDGGVHIATYSNLFGLRQPDNVAFYKSKGGIQYLLTANEGNAKYYDSVTIGDAALDASVFTGDVQDEDHLGRLQVLSGAGSEYGQNDDGEFETLYTFGSRDWTAWQIDANSDASCPCDYPSSLKLVFSSLDDFEQQTAAQLGEDGFNSDLFTPSGDVRSDDKGPEPESLVVGTCSNGHSFAFIGLERAGGVMVYDITDIDDNNVHFVEYLNSRDLSVDYTEGTRPPQSAGNVEPETLIFVPDVDDEEALLIVGYKTSASIVAYTFDCASYADHDLWENYVIQIGDVAAPIAPDDHWHTADECDDQSSCLHVVVDQVITEDTSHTARRLADSDLYRVCLSMDLSNPYCTKTDDHFTYAATLHEEEVQDEDALSQWMDGTTRCQYAQCGQSVSFAVRDGLGCAASDSLLGQTFGGVDNIECHASGQQSCHWTVPTPACASVNMVNSIVTESPQIIDPIVDPIVTEVLVQETVDITDDGQGTDQMVKKEPLIDDVEEMETLESTDASTCTDQSNCVHLEVTTQGEAAEETYQICMYWQQDTQCAKSDEDSFATAVAMDQVSVWQSGVENSICNVVTCGTEAVFSVKDGDSCSDIWTGTVDSMDVSCSANGDDACSWTVPAPECLLHVLDTGNEQLDDYLGENEEQQTDGTWHTITNQGGHFYESTVFYVLLAVSALTCISVVGSVVKLSKGAQSMEGSLDLHEEPLEPSDWDPEKEYPMSKIDS